MNRNKSCVICDEIFPNPTNMQKIEHFLKILKTFGPNKSFNIMALESLNYYNKNIMRYKREFLDRGEKFPDLTKNQILYHLRNCNTCTLQSLYSTFEFLLNQQNYYKNKIEELRTNNTDEMTDDDDEEDNNREEDINGCINKYKTFNIMMLNTNKAICQNMNTI